MSSSGPTGTSTSTAEAIAPVWESEYRDHLASRRFGEARGTLAIATAVATTPSERRKLGHLRARILIHEERFEEALAELEAVRTELGDHVQLTADIANCFFVLGRAVEFHSCLEKLRLTMNLVQERLGAESAIIAASSQAQFLEERGEVAGAMILYDALVERHRLNLSETELCFVLSQMIRLQCRTGLSHGLPRLDTALGDLNPDSRALPGRFLATLELRGAAAALADSRVGPWLRGESPEAAATLELRRIALYEGIEYVLLRGLEMPEEFLSLAESMTGRTAIEEQIHRIANAGIRELELEMPSEFTARAGVGATLRLLSLLIATEPSGIVRLLLKDRYLGLSDTLALEAQNGWERRLEVLSGDEPLDLILQRDEKTVFYMDRSLSLETKLAFWNLLHALGTADDRSMKLRDAVLTIWPGQGADSDIFRVTSVIGRLNRAILRFAGRGRALLVQGGRIQLSPGVQLYLD